MSEFGGLRKLYKEKSRLLKLSLKCKDKGEILIYFVIFVDTNYYGLLGFMKHIKKM